MKFKTKHEEKVICRGVFSAFFPPITFRIPEGRQAFEEEDPDIEKRNRDIEDGHSEVEENEVEHPPNIKAVKKSKKIKPAYC